VAPRSHDMCFSYSTSSHCEQLLGAICSAFGTVCSLVDLSVLKQHTCAFIFKHYFVNLEFIIKCPNGIGVKLNI
jgi:hypothetical protein